MVLAFALTTELFAKNSPSVLYSRAVDLIRESDAVSVPSSARIRDMSTRPSMWKGFVAEGASQSCGEPISLCSLSTSR